MGKGENRPVKMFRLKQQIFSFLAVFIVIVLLLLGIFLAIMIRYYQRNQNQVRLSELKTYAETVDGNISQLNDVVGSIYSASSAFQGIYSYQTIAEKCEHVYNLMSTLQVQVQSNHYLGGLFVYYDYGDEVLYYTDEKLSYSETKTLWNTGKSYIANSAGFSYSDFVQKTENDLYYSVFMKKDSAVISGSISLSQGVPEQPEDSATYGIVCDGRFYRTAGQEGNLSEEECGTLKPGRNKVGDKFVYLQKLNSEDMAVVEILPQSLWMYVNVWHIVLMVSMVLLTAWMLFLYRFIYNQLAGPLEDMTKTLLDIRKGDWEVNFTAPNRIVEIESVRQTVRIMLKEIGQYKIRTYEEQLERQKTQLQFLQLQLAPHFYTNCLKNIYYMLMMKEYENAEQFLMRLSRHLRYLLQRDATLVTVQTEREFVENYISLQKLLSSRPVTCTISVDETIEEQEIPILSLQTFVENSVKYTEVDRERILAIQVQIRRIETEKGECLDIIVRDNGPGYPTAMLAVLNRDKELLSDKDFGVGILNLLSRLRIHYGEEADWYFDNREGAFSELILPVGQE